MKKEHRFEIVFDGAGYGGSAFSLRCIDPCPDKKQSRPDPEWDALYCICSPELELLEVGLHGSVTVRIRGEGMPEEFHGVVIGSARPLGSRKE